MKPVPRLFVLAFLALLLLAGPVAAAEGGTPLFAGYWDACQEYWEGFVKQQNGVVIAVLAVGVVALLIITRSGNWQK